MVNSSSFNLFTHVESDEAIAERTMEWSLTRLMHLSSRQYMHVMHMSISHIQYRVLAVIIRNKGEVGS